MALYFGYQPLPLRLQFPLLRLQLPVPGLQFPGVRRQFRLPPGHLLLGRLDLAQQPVGPQFVLVEIALGLGQNLRAQTQLPGDLQGIGGPHHPVGQAIGGPPGLLVEDHRHVFEAFGALGKPLQQGNMGRRRPIGSPLIEDLQQS